MCHQTCISCDKKKGKWQIELKIAIIVIVPHNIFEPNIIYIYNTIHMENFIFSFKVK
jgi:hypothetical protein